MLHKVMNGYTVIAHEWTGKEYVILASYRKTFGYEYVTAYVRNIDLDTSWDSGNYFNSLHAATSDFYSRVPVSA
jgi:hypothetical protein